MKKTSIPKRILFPSAIIMLLLPLISGFIFYASAMQYAYKQAERELESLNESVLSAMKRNYTEASFDSFLSQIALISSGNLGNARLIILSGENHVIYPRDATENPEIQQLADDFIFSPEQNVSGNIEERKASDGQKYLITIHEAQQKSKRFGGVITYCPAENIGSWVGWATLTVFIISVLSAIIVLLVIYVSCKSITEPLKQLCTESKRIGYGDFGKIEPSFSFGELEFLRISMNRMAEQLQQSDRMQKLFFQNASHELRNPLMSISGYAQGIEQGVFSDNKAAAHTILEETSRLTEIVESLLTLSKLDTQKFDPAINEVNIQDVIENCLDRIYGLAVRNKIVLSFEEIPSDLVAVCNEELLEKMVDNILSNAVRYAKNQVSVSAKKSDNKLYICISDDGEGISKEDLPHIFERFYKGKGGNYGIGLAITASAAKIMNADISVQNLPQGGACFTIVLPVNTR